MLRYSRITAIVSSGFPEYMSVSINLSQTYLYAGASIIIVVPLPGSDLTFKIPADANAIGLTLNWAQKLTMASCNVVEYDNCSFKKREVIRH